MANLTVAIDDELLKRARMRALERGTSVNALLRDYLEAFSNPSRSNNAREALTELSLRAVSGSGDEGRTWIRDGAHER